MGSGLILARTVRTAALIVGIGILFHGFARTLLLFSARQIGTQGFGFTFFALFVGRGILLALLFCHLANTFLVPKVRLL